MKKTLEQRVNEVLGGIKLHPWFERFFADFNNFDDHRNNKYILVGVPGCAKTTLASILAVWLCEEYPNSQILLLSADKQQAENNIFSMVVNILRVNEKNIITAQKCKLPNGSEILLTAYNERKETSLRGYHPKTKDAIIAVFVDEGIGLKEQAFSNIRGIHAQGISFEMIMSNGWGYDSKQFLPALWFANDGDYKKFLIRATTEDIIMTESTKQFFESASKMHGTRYSLSMLCGGLDISDGFVTYADLQQREDNDLLYKANFPIMAIDCASGYSKGVHAICIRDNDHLLYLTSRADTLDGLAKTIISLKKSYKVSTIYIDATGVGKLVRQFLVEKYDLNIRAIYTNKKMRGYESYRAYLISRLIKWLLSGMTCASFSPPLKHLLTSIKLSYNQANFITATNKKDLKALSGSGGVVDEFDALCYSFATASGKTEEYLINIVERLNYGK